MKTPTYLPVRRTQTLLQRFHHIWRRHVRDSLRMLGISKMLIRCAVLHVYRIIESKDTMTPQNTINPLGCIRERLRSRTRVRHIHRLVHDQREAMGLDGVHQRGYHLLSQSQLSTS